MRPRLLHLGSMEIRSANYVPGRRFNEAEAFTPRIPAGILGFLGGFVGCASMRPRLLHLGSDFVNFVPFEEED